MPTLDGDIRSRLCPESFPRPTSTVSVIETHISLVFLTQSHVYKTKKPVRFPFLDYSTLESRLNACRDEIRINRRLAPNVYLGVLPITKEDTKLRIDGTGPIVDYCVEMIRLPDDQLLDRRIVAGKATTNDIDRIIDLLIPFFQSQRCSTEVSGAAAPAVLTASTRENMLTVEPLIPDEATSMFKRIRSSQSQFLALWRETFRERIDSGAIVEGHGDLRPEHICMTDPPVIFDAVEFSQSLRTADVASELAFLAMECDFLHAHSLGTYLIETYERRSGDSFPLHLVPFYQAYRATVRAKVHLLQAAQKRADVEHHRLLFHRYFHLAAAYASDFHQPAILLLMGASGVGKSTVAQAVADQLGAEWLRTDQIRQEISGGRNPNAPIAAEMYGEQMTERTYDELIRRRSNVSRVG